MVITHTEQVLREVLQFSGPADVVISRYFRETGDARTGRCCGSGLCNSS